MTSSTDEKGKAPDVTARAAAVTSRLLKGAATVATLPVWIVGNALMVPLLRRQLRREAAKVQSLTVERAEVQRKLNLANATVHEQIRALQAKDIEYGNEEASRREAEDLALKIADERDDARSRLDEVAAEKGRWKLRLAEAEADLVRVADESARAIRRADKAEGQLGALRSAVREALYLPVGMPRRQEAMMDILCAALDGAPPAQDTPSIRVRVKLSQPSHAFDWRDCPSGGTPPVQDAPHQLPVNYQSATDGATWTAAVGGAHQLPPRLPVQDAPLTADDVARAHMRSMSEPFFSARRRAAVEGDHPAGDPVTQQWAGIVEDMQRKRDEDTRRLETAWQERDALRLEVQRLTDRANDSLGLISEAIDDCGKRVPGQSQYRTAADLLRSLRFEVDRLRREQTDTDRDHDAALVETRAQHRRNLAEALRCKDASWPELLAEVHKLRRKVEGKS